MSISQIADLADLFAALGVIGSLLFVGIEVRRNTSLSKLQNWASLIDRFVGIFSQTTNIEFADVVARGRQDYEALTEAERIAYGGYLYSIVVGLEAFINFSRNEVHGKSEMQTQFDNAIRHYVGCPGGLAWLREYQARTPLPAMLAQRIDAALAKPPSLLSEALQPSVQGASAS